MVEQIEAEERFDELLVLGAVTSGPVLDEWQSYFEARAYGTDEDGHKATICGYAGSTPEEALKALRIGVVFGRPDFKVESICMFECCRRDVWQ